MGHLTTFTIYNDCLDVLTKEGPIGDENRQEFINTIVEGATKVPRDITETYSVGYNGNFVSVQGARHADDRAVFIHSGNCVSLASSKVKLEEYSDRHLDNLIDEMTYALKLAKQVKKERRDLRRK